jgi:hypothetical protein
LTTEIEELYGFDGTKQLNRILSSVREKAMRDLERTKERKFLFFYQMHFQVDVVILTRVLYFLFL